MIKKLEGYIGVLLGFAVIALLALFIDCVFSRAAHAQVCPPAGCKLVCEGDPVGSSTLETNAPSGGPVVPVQLLTYVGNLKLASIERLVLPDLVGGQPNDVHAAAFAPVKGVVPAAKGLPFAANLAPGAFTAKLRRFRWLIVESVLKDPNGLPPDTAVLTKRWGCYQADNTVLLDANGDPVGSFDASWEDQFGPHAASFSSNTATVCVPDQAFPTARSFVCFGRSVGVGPGPGTVGIDTPYTTPQMIETDRTDEKCFVVTP